VKTEPRTYHYIRRNELTRIPRAHVILDCGAQVTRTPSGHDRTWRNAYAWFSRAPKGKAAKEWQAAFNDPGALWRAISDHCGRKARTVVWSHNTGYQARVSEAFIHLPALGWELAGHNLVPRGCWMTWRRDGATLVMVDVASVWPTTLASIGKMFGLAQPSVPDVATPEDVWRVWCERNVHILRTAVTAYLAWLSEHDMGNWQLTGAGQSWAAYRHKWMHHDLLVHGDADALAAERRAMWTGRCEAYWHGTELRQVLHEWDLSTAYARVARDARLPVRLLGPVPPNRSPESYVDDPRYVVLAEVSVETETPTVPTLHDDRILWPVGRFDTTLWDVEIQEAIADGATVTYGRAWLYRAEPALRGWAQWVLNSLSASDDVVPAWRKAIIRHWSRALVGRFAMQYSTWADWATSSTMDVERRTVIDEIEDSTYDILHIGAQIFREEGVEEWSNSMPAITGYVMALCRIRLWRLKKALPEGCVLYVDTDSLLATDLFSDEIAALARSSQGEGLRLKTSWQGFSLYGPRQIVTGDRVRMGGIPVRALRTARHKFEGEVYESVDVALRHGRASIVKAVDRTWTTTSVDRRRSGPSVGWTSPYRIEVPAS
jgi:hypothetical protein